MTTPIPQAVTHVTFDIYGTLIDWEQGIYDAFVAEAAADGREVGRDIVGRFDRHEREIQRGAYRPYEEVLAHSATLAAAELGWQLPRERASFLARSVKDWRPFPGVPEQLARLGRHVKLGVLSNISHDLVQGSFAQLRATFDTVVTAEDVRGYKPGHQHFVDCRRRLGEEAATWAHVTAHLYHDVTPCNALGVPVVWIDLKGEERGSATPSAEVASLSEAADLLIERAARD